VFFALLTLITALAIAGVAAWFSIVGLMAIFSGVAIPILIMGSVLEVGKLVTASWLYRNKDHASFLLKTYLTTAVIVLMFITSMGIFGFLSKAHLEQAQPTGNNLAKIERLDQRISREKIEIVDANKVTSQLDEAVNTLIDYDRIRGKDGSIAVRQLQKDERLALKTIINEAQDSIDALEDEKFELSSAVREFELEVGPIRYVAELLYEDPKSNLETTVRWVIIILVSVFDPLAVLLLIAANNSLMHLQPQPVVPIKHKKDLTAPDDDSILTSEVNKTIINDEPEQPQVSTQERTKGGWLSKGK